MTTALPKARSKIFHIPKGIAYAIQNSIWAMHLAYALGFRWIDIDGQVSKDDIPMGMHWNNLRKNGYVLPPWFTRKYGNDPNCDQCLAADMVKLVTKKVWYRGKFQVTRCCTLETLLRGAVRSKMGVMYEEKGAEEFRLDAVQKAISNARIRSGLPENRFMVGALDEIPGYLGRLKAASKYHDTVVLKHTTKPIPREYAQYIDWYRGKKPTYV